MKSFLQKITETPQKTKNTNITKITANVFSVLFFFVMWQFLSKKIASPLILPKPFEVLKIMPQLLTEKTFQIHFLQTFLRVVYAFLISISAGFFLGLICAKNNFFKYFFDFPLQIIRTTPVISVILIALFWFNSNFLPVFVSVLMNLPIVITCVQEGFLSVSKKELFLAQVFRISKTKRFFYIEFPACLPYFINSVDSVFGLCWKVVVAGEVMCLPKNAVGKVMANAQVNLENKMVLAITVLLIIASYLTQILIKKLFLRLCKNL